MYRDVATGKSGGVLTVIIRSSKYSRSAFSFFSIWSFFYSPLYCYCLFLLSSAVVIMYIYTCVHNYLRDILFSVKVNKGKARRIRANRVCERNFLNSGRVHIQLLKGKRYWNSFRSMVFLLDKEIGFCWEKMKIFSKWKNAHLTIATS